MKRTFPWRANHIKKALVRLDHENLEMAKTVGAAAGLHGVDDDFVASVEARLHCNFVALYGDLGPEPDVLSTQQAALETDRTRAQDALHAHQETWRHSVVCPDDAPAAVNLRLCLGTGLCCGLVGLVGSLMGVEMLWQHWAILGVVAGLIVLFIQALPRWVRAGRYSIRRRTLQRHVKRVDRKISRLKEAAAQEARRRSQRDQFIAPRQALLVTTFEYYKAAGVCAANQKRPPNLVAA